MKCCCACSVRPTCVPCSVPPLLCAMVQPEVGDGAQGADQRDELSLGKIVGTDYSMPMPDVRPRGATPLVEPKEPTAAERARHMLTHLPYCLWCPYCIAGRKPNCAHRRQRNERTIPMLSCDYGFFRDPGEQLFPFIVVHIQPYGVYFAAVIDAKGANADVAKSLATVIQ